MRIERTVVIDRPPEHVWGFIADARNDPQWCEKVESVEQTSGDGPGPTATYRVRHRPKPFKPATALAVEVVGFEPPRRLGLREEDEDAVFNVVYELEPHADGARLSQIDDIEWKISRLLAPIARVMVRRHLGRQFATLKTLLEADGSGV